MKYENSQISFRCREISYHKNPRHYPYGHAGNCPVDMIKVVATPRSRSGDDEGGRDASLERCGASLSLSELDMAETLPPPSPLWRSRDQAGEDSRLVEDVAAFTSAAAALAVSLSRGAPLASESSFESLSLS